MRVASRGNSLHRGSSLDIHRHTVPSAAAAAELERTALMQSHLNRLAIRSLLAACALALLCFAWSGSAQAAPLPNLTLTIAKSSITVGGSTQSGGVNLTATATGVKEPSAVLFLIRPGVTTSEVESALKGSKDPNKTSRYGSIVFDAEIPTGKSAEAQTYLQPGQYLALLPGEGKSAGAHTFFTVTPSPSPVALPVAQATIRSIEFGFLGPKTLHDGELVRFEDEGFLVHMDVAFPVKSLRAAKQVVQGMHSGHEKGLQKLAAGQPFEFQGPVSHEAFQQVTITAKPGWYVQACFMETQDGRIHTVLGMERIIKITK